MENHHVLSLLLLLTFSSHHAYAYNICDQAICEYTFEIRRLRTLTYYEDGFAYNVELNGTRLQAAENSYKLKVDRDVIGKELNPDDVITADGYVRDVITINGQFPGPDIQVIAGAQVVVHVRNRLGYEATTIHWHGLHMQDTPWMDGVPHVTQCPILPKQTFTYRFLADPPGTRWYHSHVGSQRLDGLYGMLIIHPSIPTTPEFVFTVTDWLHKEAFTEELMVDVINRDFVLNDEHMKVVKFYGAMINGRGRYNELPYPLTEFKVTKGQRTRFRMASTGVEYSFKISIDNHQMDIVAVDGGEIQPIRVDTYIINTGETLDFEVVADQGPGRYWMRAAIIGHDSGPDPESEEVDEEPDMEMGMMEMGVKGIITYEGAPSTGEPTSSGRMCTAAMPCRVFGCIYGRRPANQYTTCIGMEDARSTINPMHLQDQFGINDPDNEVIEYFYNFAFSAGSSVNARKFVESRAPLYFPDADKYITPGDEKVCDAQGCRCTNIDEFPFNKTVQIVLINQTPEDEVLAHHIIHLHGHSFAVMRVGYVEQDETTGLMRKHNQDIQCYSDNLDICTKARWANQRPALNKDNPPIKNNILLPARGYTVIRFRSNNPGFWIFHCHMEQHFKDGMAMIVNTGPGRHPPIPADFPDCQDFSWTGDQFSDYISGVRNTRLGVELTEPESEERSETAVQEIIAAPETGSDTILLTVNTAIGVSFGFILLGAFLPLVAIAMYACCSARKDSHGGK